MKANPESDKHGLRPISDEAQPSASTFGKRKAALAEKAAPQRERRRGGDRRKKPRRAELQDDRSADPVSSYRKRALALRELADADRNAERKRVLLKIVRDYERLADVLEAIDRVPAGSDDRSWDAIERKLRPRPTRDE